MVKQVMSRLIPISGLRHYNWEIYVIDDPRKLYSLAVSSLPFVTMYS